MTESVTVTRRFAADARSVFDLFVIPEKFAVWFGTEATTIEKLEMTPEVGSDFSFDMVLPDGSVKQWAGSFTAIDAPHHVTFEITDEPGDMARLPVDITLAADGDGTRMVLTQPTPGWPQEAQDGLTAGYNAFADSMARLVESH